MIENSAILKNLLPRRLERVSKRWYFQRQIRNGRFRSPEPEYDRVAEFAGSGDWVIDIGANVGHYTLLFSRIVGAGGRVIALEPVPETFDFLVANCALASYRNITLLNLAASDRTGIVSMEVPKWKGSDRSNLYEAKVISAADNSRAISALGIPIDGLTISNRISLIKIDVEGHEEQAVRGMRNLLSMHKPTLIIEGSRADSQLLDLGYRSTHVAGSPNHVWRHCDRGIDVRHNGQLEQTHK